MNFLAKLPARMTLSAAAVLTVLGAAAAGAAPAMAAGPSPSPSGAEAKSHWHAFKLQNFWTSASTAKQPTGAPAWALQGGRDHAGRQQRPGQALRRQRGRLHVAGRDLLSGAGHHVAQLQ